MDRRDIYHGNIILGVVILGFGVLRMFFEKRTITSISPFAVFAAVFLIAMGLYGLKYSKK